MCSSFGQLNAAEKIPNISGMLNLRNLKSSRIMVASLFGCVVVDRSSPWTLRESIDAEEFDASHALVSDEPENGENESVSGDGWHIIVPFMLP